MDVLFGYIDNEKILFDNLAQIPNGKFIFCKTTERFYLKMNDKLIGISPSAAEMTRRKKKVYNCKNCGAPMKMVDKYSSLLECKYCGTIQDIDD